MGGWDTVVWRGSAVEAKVGHAEGVVGGIKKEGGSWSEGLVRGVHVDVEGMIVIVYGCGERRCCRVVHMIVMGGGSISDRVDDIDEMLNDAAEFGAMDVGICLASDRGSGRSWSAPEAKQQGLEESNILPFLIFVAIIVFGCRRGGGILPIGL